MKEQFCSWEISLTLEELGFNEPCIGFYYNAPKPEMDEFSIGVKSSVVDSMTSTNECFKAPLWQQAIDWIWDNHQLCIYFKPDRPNIGDVEYVIEKQFEKGIVATEVHMILDHARESAILKAIEIIKERK